MRTLPSNLRLIYKRVYLHKIKLTTFPKVKQWQSQKEKSENICLSGENREITYLFRQTFLSSYTSLSLKIAFGNCTHGSRKLHKGDFKQCDKDKASVCVTLCSMSLYVWWKNALLDTPIVAWPTTEVVWDIGRCWYEAESHSSETVKGWV